MNIPVKEGFLKLYDANNVCFEYLFSSEDYCERLIMQYVREAGDEKRA